MWIRFEDALCVVWRRVCIGEKEEEVGPYRKGGVEDDNFTGGGDSGNST